MWCKMHSEVKWGFFGFFSLELRNMINSADILSGNNIFENTLLVFNLQPEVSIILFPSHIKSHFCQIGQLLDFVLNKDNLTFFFLSI